MCFSTISTKVRNCNDGHFVVSSNTIKNIQSYHKQGIFWSYNDACTAFNALSSSMGGLETQQMSYVDS